MEDLKSKNILSNNLIKNLIIFVLIIGSLVLGYFLYTNDINYKKEIKVIKKERDFLEMKKAELEYEYRELEKKKQKILYLTKETEDKLNNQENETDAIPGIVATYSNHMLDSILTNYRFKPRAKSGNSNRP